ncbi:MAG: hypothetical protein AB7E32_17260 [Desulfovibrio sp.]
MELAPDQQRIVDRVVRHAHGRVLERVELDSGHLLLRVAADGVGTEQGVK